MNRTLLVSILSLGGLLLVTTGHASAQYSPYPQYTNPYARPPAFSPYNRPGLSPYLNFLRGGDPAANYYLGVIPERQRRAAEYQFQSSILDLERGERAAPTDLDAEDLLPALPGTGHPAVFMNYGSYFSSGYSPRYAPFTQPPGAGIRRGIR